MTKIDGSSPKREENLQSIRNIVGTKILRGREHFRKIGLNKLTYFVRWFAQLRNMGKTVTTNILYNKIEAEKPAPHRFTMGRRLANLLRALRHSNKAASRPVMNPRYSAYLTIETIRDHSGQTSLRMRVHELIENEFHIGSNLVLLLRTRQVPSPIILKILNKRGRSLHGEARAMA